MAPLLLSRGSVVALLLRDLEELARTMSRVLGLVVVALLLRTGPSGEVLALLIRPRHFLSMTAMHRWTALACSRSSHTAPCPHA